MKLLKKVQYNSPVVLTFALISLAALLLNELTKGVSNRLLFSVYRSSLADPLTYPRFFLHVLGHANYTHYIGNMLLLLVIGPSLEEKYGGRALLIAIIATAFISGIAHWILLTDTAVLGASGIVFMMIVMSSFAGMKNGRLPVTLIFVLVFYLGKEIIDGLFTSDNISQLGHLVGGVCGAFIGFRLSKRKKP
jgi:membrane associated rhomboid family serine protease